MSEIKVCPIVAVADNGVIGKDNDLPWRIKSEFSYFKSKTMGHPIVMGRKSFDALGKPLPGRTNIIITRDKSWHADGAMVAHTLEEGIAIAKDIARKDGKDEVFIGGGAEIYKLALPLSDRLYYTEVHLKPEGQIHFPTFDRSQWVEIKREFHEALPGEDGNFTITVLDRKDTSR